MAILERFIAKTENVVSVPEASAIAGLTFRGFRGPEDYPAMLAVLHGSKQVDGLERIDTVEDIALNYSSLTNSDPFQDMLFAEIRGQVIGYSRVWWWKNLEDTRLYQHFALLLPQWRETGVRRAMLRYNERRLREIAAGHPLDGPRFFEVWASEGETDWSSLLEREGYQPFRYGFSMVRPNLENIPDCPLPEGIDIRPVPPESYRAVGEAAREAFRDEWGYSDDEWTDAQFESFCKSRWFQPHLWQVAWDGDQVAGMVLNFILDDENQEYQRLRGYTETICVRRPYRKQGVAKALIARSFHLLREQGMTEAALSVDAENPNGALQLYQSMGFAVNRREAVYRKPLE